ncbi:MAG: FAD-dependent oxidoreductase, partial [Caulobacteraceae bacterium]|nr:FAD-dependent oxidoreductase [Caulobacter sp.]
MRGEPRRPDLPGAGLPGVHVLRTRDDAAAILRDAEGRPRVVIIGGGFIGLEAASALRQQKLDVTVVIPHEVPFRSILGEEIGARLRRLHEENGVRFVVGEAERFVGADRVRAVRLGDGNEIEAELVLIGMGIAPATGFARALAPAEDGGLDTDRTLRVRGEVFAAGDVARFPFGADDAKRIRVEHWRVAEQQGRLAARNMLGGSQPFDAAPFFWTLHH